MCWNPKITSVKVLEEHEQALHCEIVDVRNGVEQQIIAIYALNTNEQRKQLWTFLNRRCENNTQPLLIGGDFNTVLCAADRFQGNQITEADVQDFSNCIKDNELYEVRYVGSDYTWYNNQEGEHRICSNIDRCVANIQWLQKFSQLLVERLENGVSDHCPQLLNFELNNIRRKAPFKFLNVIVDHESFEQVLRTGWTQQCHTNRLLNIWFKCKNLKVPLKAINTQFFLKTTEKMEGIRNNLHDIQKKLLSDIDNSQLISEEKDVMKELEKWSGIEEAIWKQKSRVDWLNLGDANNKFFHAYINARHNLNAIQLLLIEDGTKCHNQEQVKEEVRLFYVTLMGSSAEDLPMVDKSVIDRGPILNASQQRILCAPCEENEVKRPYIVWILTKLWG